MPSNITEYPQPPFTHGIRLYGDRVGSKGAFKFAGFAWIHTAKVILVQGEIASDSKTLQTTDWRCLLRLIRLAHRLKKPIVFWNLSVVRNATHQRGTALDYAHVIQDTELELLKLPYPIITVFDQTHPEPYPDPEIFWSDVVILPKPAEPQFSENEKIKLIEHPDEIAPAIVERLSYATATPATELLKNRQETLRTAVRISTEPPSNEVKPHV